MQFQAADTEIVNVSVSNTGNFYLLAPKCRLVQITHVYERYVACIAERRGANRILVARLGKPMRRYDNIKMDVQAKSTVILLSDKHNYIDIICLVYIRYYHVFRPYTSAIISRALVHKNSEKGRDLCM
jgi:hypothetical protein